MLRRHFLMLSLARRGAVRLHASTYGMQTLAPDAAIGQLQQIGYDGIELCLMPGWPTEPSRLDGAARGRIRKSGLPVPTLIENFNTLVADAEHQRTLDRIRAAAELAHAVSPGAPPLLQSVLGGKPAEWEQVKETMGARLAEWGRVARASGIRLAVKSHFGSAANTPERLLWLLDRAGNPAISGIYDYSHFQLMGLELKPTLELLLPRSAFVTVKDGRLENGAPRFLLPGDGSVDYPGYFALLRGHRYQGWMLVEVSRQLQTQPGFDPVDAARRSYRNLAPLLAAAGLRKQQR